MRRAAHGVTKRTSKDDVMTPKSVCKSTLMTTTLCATGLHSMSPAFASDAQGWELLSQIKLEVKADWDTMQVVLEKTYPTTMGEVVEEFTITGYVAGEHSGETEISELLILSDIGFCPLCGGGDHTTSLTVELDGPIAALEPETRITVTGTLVRVGGNSPKVAKLTAAQVNG